MSRGDYGWLDGEGGPLQPIRRDFDLPDYPGEARLIAVQAAPSVAETEFLLSLAERAGSPIAGVVGWIDLAEDGAGETLRRLAANPAFKGVRPMLQDIAQTDWLLEEACPEALDTLQELGLRFDALVTERHLPMLEAFAAARPDLPLVVDHAAKPQPGARPGWEEGMAALARLPHVRCKLSGLLTELSEAERADPLPALQAILERLLDWFGPERLMWGSDWPVLTLAASWQTWRELTDRLLAPLSERERRAILHDNAAGFYGVAP
ncbi:Amidohydrolase family superfamily protein [Oceanicola granulosus HTCC2516]|uniref:Amidohydrolase family superfamily protein n=1 Tax=Oceanicola granulosus (strain ATCC BAA-861 / DSM 15982 / KCTC 12143 / HTCC2516) TaxID=314256 RepID=Q2CIL8_OCEGH|nr:Amidohydrolase family superfamily protein [Oceanicola granulosus HTCC2516]